MQDDIPDTPEKPRIKVTDFGFATLFDDILMQIGCGSPNYMAPEIVTRNKNKRLDMKVDIWAIGCITYYIFLGNQAFNAKDRE